MPFHNMFFLHSLGKKKMGIANLVSLTFEEQVRLPRREKPCSVLQDSEGRKRTNE